MTNLTYTIKVGYWQKIVENFLYRNYIKFKVTIEKPEKLFSGGDKAIFQFTNLTDKEGGLVEGFFNGLKDASEGIRERL